MEQKSMTALISAFARWYHANNNDVRIFDDSIAGKILSDDEKQQIAESMSSGIKFFNPAFIGTKEEALRWIVDKQLSPSPLGRSAWAERALQTAVKAGVCQYIIVAAGYETFVQRRPTWASGLKIFELDTPSMSLDKQMRVQRLIDEGQDSVLYVPIDITSESLYAKLCSCGEYNKNKLSFFSLLGITYYISKESFMTMVQDIASTVAYGSTIVFDYPDEYTYAEQAGERAKKQVMMASVAGETMLAGYSYKEMEQLLSDCGFLIYEHLTPDEITKQYFANYNKANPQHIMTAFDNVNYCLAVRR